LSQDLVVLNNNAALTNAVSGSSWGDDEEVIKPRYIALKNPKSTVLEDYKNGHFVDKEARKAWDTMKLVLLGIRLTRKLQTPYVPGEKRELLCKSINRKTPVTTDDRFEPKAEACSTCPFGPMAWSRYQKTKDKNDIPKNPCESEVELFFIEEGNPLQPYIYTINGRGRSAAEQMYDTVKAISKSTLADTGRRPELYEYVITMTSERMKDGNFIPKFVEIKEMTQEEAEARFGDAYKQFVLARRAAFEARQNAAEGAEAVEEQLQATTEVVETPAQPATKPAVAKPEYLPPASKRVAGTKPVYVPPVAADPDAPKPVI
jgi:hypothetical protein